VLQGCCKGVISMLQEWCKYLSLHESTYVPTLGIFVGYCKGVTRVLQECYKRVARVIQACKNTSLVATAAEQWVAMRDQSL
jgi:hypothetical protein